MNLITFREWSVLLCHRCEGSFYEEAVLEALLSQPDLRISYLRPALLTNLACPLSPEAGREKINCPSCQKQMTRESYSSENPLLVDRCGEGHGIWLDDGELGQLSSEWEAHYTHAEPSFWEALRRLVGLKPKLSILRVETEPEG